FCGWVPASAATASGSVAASRAPTAASKAASLVGGVGGGEDATAYSDGLDSRSEPASAIGVPCTGVTRSATANSEGGSAEAAISSTVLAGGGGGGIAATTELGSAGSPIDGFGAGGGSGCGPQICSSKSSSSPARSAMNIPLCCSFMI